VKLPWDSFVEVFYQIWEKAAHGEKSEKEP
jgi:hypothetical protein